MIVGLEIKWYNTDSITDYFSGRGIFMTIGTDYSLYNSPYDSSMQNKYTVSGNGEDEKKIPGPDGKLPEDKKPVNPDDEKKAGRRSSPAECETCKNRKYKDGSDENVSFKTATHISPQSAGAAVRAHEGEHVSNAYKKAAQNNGQVVSAAVSIHTSVCPECGRSYISGGTTNTMIKYTNESNPYQKELKAADSVKLRGANIDLVA